MQNADVGTPQVETAAQTIRARWTDRPRAGIILGSGLGSVIEHVHIAAEIDFREIPGYTAATAPGHRGRLLCGVLAGVPLVAMDGRLHGYEGHPAAQVAFPVRVMAALGVEVLILTNACGGMNPHYQAGDLMLVSDHINLTFDNPLVGPTTNHPRGLPDLSCPYDPRLLVTAAAIARQRNIVAHRGVYVGVMGPNYETRAEYRFFRRLGGDAVGMSTVAEVIMAAHCGLRVLAMSVVTNVCLPDAPRTANGDAVIATAQESAPRLQAIVSGILAGLPPRASAKTAAPSD